jgi:putative toxin-antitoxin system antitoxin component (TIGR02293 family)
MKRESLLKYGMKVFNNETDKFSNWLLRPNKALADRKPNDLLETLEGRLEVKNILDKIEYGIFN